MNPELRHSTANYNSAEMIQHFKSCTMPALLRVYALLPETRIWQYFGSLLAPKPLIEI